MEEVAGQASSRDRASQDSPDGTGKEGGFFLSESRTDG